MDTRRTENRELSKASNRTERRYYPEISGRGDRIVSVCSLHDLVARRGARGFLDENRRNSLQKDKELILICTLRVVSLFFPTIAGVTILLSLTVFLNLVAESMPTTSDAVPLIGTYAYHHDSYASVCLTVSVISMFPCKYVHVHRNCACRIEPFLFRK